MNETVRLFGEQMISERVGSYRTADSEALLLAAGYGSEKITQERNKYSRNSYEMIHLVRFGLNPVTALDRGFPVKNPYRENVYEPLQLALFFAKYVSRKEGLLVIDLRRRLIEDYKERTRYAQEKGKADRAPYKSPFPTNFWGDDRGAVGWMQDRTLFRTWVPPDPTEYGMPLVDFVAPLDSMFMAPWFDDDVLRGLVEKHGDGTGAGTLAQIAQAAGKDWGPSLAARAAKQAYRHLIEGATGRPRYAEIAQYVRLCTKSDIDGIFEKVSGSRRALMVVRPDASVDQFITGLREVAKATPENQKTLLSLLGRSPTVDELKAIRSSGILELIDKMPWTLLQPLLEERRNALLAVCLPYVDRVPKTLVDRYLTEHSGRVAHAAASAMSAHGMVVQGHEIAEWDAVFGEVHKHYAEANALRKDVLALAGDVATAFLFFLKPFGSSSPYIEEVTKTHSNWLKIVKRIGDYKPPRSSY